MCFFILLHMTEIEKKFKETCISILNDNMSDEIFVDYTYYEMETIDLEFTSDIIEMKYCVGSIYLDDDGNIVISVYSPDYEGMGYLEHTLSEFDDNLLEDILHLIDNGEFDVY